ncbi:Zn(II)2Cys6 transcription factor domain-containing protein [Aspergillus undulatus]|uniref:Zn(II)2Cys6 transcription factor domain-containing protein n=1 Tax=Aspergillus undulatus TaxID=1810928 RepID=UPI003CCD4C8D
MVGVPGRSKACVTCLKRKKRCDLEKPFCGTCRKARVEYGGYTTSMQLVKEERSNSAPDVALPPALVRSAYQARYMDLFWQMYLPNGQALSIEVTQVALGGWIDAIHDLQNHETVLKKALVAMSVSAVGRQENNKFLKEEGRRLYTNSLQSLSATLQDPKRATSDSIWTAIRLASFWESMFGQNDGEVKQVRSWQAHNAGEIALISTRSPYMFISGHVHGLFADSRSNLLFRQTLTDEFNGLQQELVTWQLLHAPDFELYEAAPKKLLSQQIAVSHLMTTFWATEIIVASNLQVLCLPGEELDIAFDLDLCCANITRTFPLFIYPAMGLFRTHVTTYPMTVAMHYICSAGPKRLVNERRILADCLFDPALVGVRQFMSHMKDEFPMEFLK